MNLIKNSSRAAITTAMIAALATAIFTGCTSDTPSTSESSDVHSTPSDSISSMVSSAPENDTSGASSDVENSIKTPSGSSTPESEPTESEPTESAPASSSSTPASSSSKPTESKLTESKPTQSSSSTKSTSSSSVEQTSTDASSEFDVEGLSARAKAYYAGIKNDVTCDEEIFVYEVVEHVTEWGETEEYALSEIATKYKIEPVESKPIEPKPTAPQGTTIATIQGKYYIKDGRKYYETEEDWKNGNRASISIYGEVCPEGKWVDTPGGHFFMGNGDYYYSRDDYLNCENPLGILIYDPDLDISNDPPLVLV